MKPPRKYPYNEFTDPVFPKRKKPQADLSRLRNCEGGAFSLARRARVTHSTQPHPREDA